MSRRFDRRKEINEEAARIHKEATENPQFIAAVFQVSLERMPLKWIFWSMWMAIWRRLKPRISQKFTNEEKRASKELKEEVLKTNGRD